MRTFGYIRVSTIEQESGHGREVQLRAITAHCFAHQLGEPELVYESASAESVAGRRELLALLATARSLAEAGEQVHIIFYRSDRLARDVIDQEGVVAQCFATGVRLHSTMSHELELFDPKYGRDPMRQAIRQFFGIFNQLDKAIIQQRLDGGLLVKASKGGSTGGRYPFGYHGLNGEIAPCPDEVPAVRRAFQLSHQGLDLASIATVLGREWPDQCGHWQKGQVKRLLDRADLYVRGLYRSRVGIEQTFRPDLIVCTIEGGVATQAAQESVSALAMQERQRVERERLDRPITWERVADPVPAQVLAALVGQPIAWIEARVVEWSLPVRLVNRRMLLPHASAQRIEQAARATRRQGESDARASVKN